MMIIIRGKYNAIFVPTAALKKCKPDALLRKNDTFANLKLVFREFRVITTNTDWMVLWSHVVCRTDLHNSWLVTTSQ